MQNYNALKHRCMNILLSRILSFHSSFFQYFRLHFTMQFLYLYWGRIMVGVALDKPIWDIRLDFKWCIGKSQPLPASGMSPLVTGNACSCLCPRMAWKWLGRFTAGRRKLRSFPFAGMNYQQSSALHAWPWGCCATGSITALLLPPAP